MNKCKGLLAAFLVLLPAAALAQEGASPVSTSASAGEEMILFQEIPSVFGASKYEQKLSESPRLHHGHRR